MIYKYLAMLKVYSNNSGFYISTTNITISLFNMILLLGWGFKSLIIIPIVLICLFGLGYLDYKKVSPHQFKYANKQNDIKHKVDEILNILKEDKKK